MTSKIKKIKIFKSNIIFFKRNINVMTLITTLYSKTPSMLYNIINIIKIYL